MQYDIDLWRAIITSLSYIIHARVAERAWTSRDAGPRGVYYDELGRLLNVNIWWLEMFGHLRKSR